ncbi:ATP-binding protein [Pseudoneobacillus sp. C159]
MQITKHLLFNFSILVGFVFIYHILTDRNGQKDSKFLWFLMLFFSLLACFIFSLELSNLFRIDLRIIPLVLAGLYFDMGWTFILIAIFIRALLGVDHGFVIFTGVYIVLAFVLKLLHPRFIRQSSYKKIITTMGITLLTQSLIIFFRHLYFGSIWGMSIPFLVFPVIGITIFVYVIEYIRETDQLKKEIYQSKKMSALEHLGAAISHEIRNPLTSAKGFVQLVKEQKEISEENRYYLEIAFGELSKSEGVIEDYLTYTKPSLEEVIELDVCRELQTVSRTISPLANRHSVNILEDFHSVDCILGDREKFRQCLFNVIKNGIESMPQGGTLNLMTKQSEKNILIIIEDNGIGMTQAQVSRIGEPYYSTKEGNGTGLGMMVVQSIIRAMKGQLRIQSRVGIGTKITIIFPSAKSMSRFQTNSSLNRGELFS